MKRIFITKNCFLVKNLFYITEELNHYTLFLPKGIIKLTKPLKFTSIPPEGYVCVNSYVDDVMDCIKNNLFVDTRRKNYIDDESFTLHVDFQLNYKITKALLKFLNYKEHEE
jgi:hypothetical protein